MNHQKLDDENSGTANIIHGDVIHGDRVGGDKYTIGGIKEGVGIAIGTGASVKIYGNIHHRLGIPEPATK